MSHTDELLAQAEAYARAFDLGQLPIAPRTKVAVVACMDARMDLFSLLGLRPGDAHVIRNAGGVVTDDVIRSIVISQRLGGTEEIVLVHHTDCGLLRITDDGFRRQLLDDVGIAPDWSAGSFRDLDDDLRRSMGRIRANAFVPAKGSVRGFVYDVATGALREVR